MKRGTRMFISIRTITIKTKIRGRSIIRRVVNTQRKPFSTNGKCHSGASVIHCVMVSNSERRPAYKSIADIMCHRHRAANQNQKTNIKPAMLDVLLSQYFLFKPLI